MIIKLFPAVGQFAENKEKAREIRIRQILPGLKDGKKITLDFNEVEGATQSFIHALISEAIRRYRGLAYDKLFYKNTNEDIQEIISTVYNYMQESLDGNEDRDL